MVDLSNIIKGLTEAGSGVVALSYVKDREGADEWTAAIHFGEEEPGSDLYAGAAYGVAPTPDQAVMLAVAETGW